MVAGVPVLPPAETAALGDLVLLGVPDDALEPVVAELPRRPGRCSPEAG